MKPWDLKAAFAVKPCSYSSASDASLAYGIGL